LALILLAGLVLVRPFAPSEGPAAAAVEPEATRIGEIRAVKLADGSRVILDTDSAVEIRITVDARMVRLVRGRARFDVTPDATRPFLVEAAGRTVTARGTLFDVGVEPGGVRVSLFRGVVEVRGAAAPGAVAAVARLAPGDCYSDVFTHSRVTRAPRGADRWVSGMLDFDGVALGEVLGQTNRYSPRKIRLGDPSLASLRVTGTFRPLPVEELAASLATAFSLRARRMPGGEILLSRD